MVILAVHRSIGIVIITNGAEADPGLGIEAVTGVVVRVGLGRARLDRDDVVAHVIVEKIRIRSANAKKSANMNGNDDAKVCPISKKNI